MIRIDKRPPTEVLMDALAVVEDAESVVIIIDKPGSFVIAANCGHKDICWFLEQAKHLVIKELFDTPSEPR